MRRFAKKTRAMRILSLIFSALFLFAALIPVLAEGEPETEAEPAPEGAPRLEAPQLEHVGGAYLYNFETDTVLYELNAEAEVYPTSTVKIMTGIVALEALADRLDEPVTVTEEMLYPVRGNAVGLMAGEIITPRQALYCLLVNNANDAAYVLAFTAAGSEEAFVGLMNKKAGELNAWNTIYTNCTGMHDDNMKTTVADTAKIAKYAYRNDTFMEMVGTVRYVLEKTNMSEYRNVYNRNCLVSKYYLDNYCYEGAVGMNAGSTPQGGYCAVAITKNADNTVTYLSVIMNAESDDEEFYNYKGTIDLLNWAFASYSFRKVIKKGQVICEMPVRMSATADYVTLAAVSDLSVFLPSDVDVEKDIKISCRTEEDFLRAPVKKGQIGSSPGQDEKLGVAMAVFEGKSLGTVDLVATSDVPRSELLFALDRVKTFSSSVFFRAAVIACVLLSVGYVLLRARYRQKKLRSRIPATRPRKRR